MNIQLILRTLFIMLGLNNSYDTVRYGTSTFTYHDYLHIIIATTLAPIKMGDYLVTGIHGIPVQEFFPLSYTNRTPLYPGILDEYRLTTHQFFIEPTLLRLASLMNASVLLYRAMGYNPLPIIYQHYLSLK